MNSMRAVILTPGPSLARYVPAEPADLTVAVNRAGLSFAADTWAALDPPMVRDHGPKVIGAPVLLTSADTPRILARDGWSWRGETVTHKALIGYLPASINLLLFTFTTAIAYCAWRGATSIDTYGCDWLGTGDFDGVIGGTNRTPDRWAMERAIYAALAEALAERGVRVTRKNP